MIERIQRVWDQTEALNATPLSRHLASLFHAEGVQHEVSLLVAALVVWAEESAGFRLRRSGTCSMGLPIPCCAPLPKMPRASMRTWPCPTSRTRTRSATRR